MAFNVNYTIYEHLAVSPNILTVIFCVSRALKRILNSVMLKLRVFALCS